MSGNESNDEYHGGGTDWLNMGVIGMGFAAVLMGLDELAHEFAVIGTLGIAVFLVGAVPKLYFAITE